MNGADSTVLYGAPHSPAQGGKDIQDFPPFSGGRLSLGLWLDDEQTFAIEASGFLLERRGAGYQARGDSNGNPIFGIPVYNSVPYQIGATTIMLGEDSLPFSLPDDPNRFRDGAGVIVGGIVIANHLQLWGADATGVVRIFRADSWQVAGLIGFRYLDLSESFDLTSDMRGTSDTFEGMSGVVTETFRTRNQFFGGSLGLRTRYALDRLAFDFTGRVALGVNHEVQSVWGGFYSYNHTGPYASGPQGVFAQPANEGRRAGNKFAVVPEAEFKVNYALTSWMRLSIGYNFLYCNNVLRPGDQINRSVPKGQTFNQADGSISATSPAPLFNTTSFFAHGATLGLDFRY